MANFLLDTFTDTAGTLLDAHMPDAGGPATKIPGLTGSAQITAAGRLRTGTPNAIVAYQYAGSPGATDYDVVADIYMASSTGDSEAAGLIARSLSNAETFYWGRMAVNNGTPAYDLYKVVSGAITQLAVTPATLTVGSTTRLKLSVRGSAITLYASTDGGVTYTSVCSANDTAITAPGLAGVGFYRDTSTSDTTGMHVDNLTGSSLITIAPNNPAWASSPGNWIIGTEAITTDFGAKRSIVVSGTSSATLTFDTSALTAASVPAGSYPQIRYSVDNGPATDVAIAGGVGIFTGLSTSAHEIVYEYVRGDFTVDAWTTPVMAVRETGLILAVGATVSAPTDLYPGSIFVAGDSITAGLDAIGSSNPGGGDGTATFAKAMGVALAAEVGVSGKGAVGWTWPGQANVPAFPASWKYAWFGQLRSFAGITMYVVNMGTNDALNSVSDAAVTAAVAAWIPAARAVLGSAVKIAILIPMAGFKRAAINAGVAAAADSNTIVADLGPIFAAQFSQAYGTPTRAAIYDGVHPQLSYHGRAGAGYAQQIAIGTAAGSGGQVVVEMGIGL